MAENLKQSKHSVLVLLNSHWNFFFEIFSEKSLRLQKKNLIKVDRGVGWLIQHYMLNAVKHVRCTSAL